MTHRVFAKQFTILFHFSLLLLPGFVYASASVHFRFAKATNERSWEFDFAQDASSPKRALWAMKRGREGNKQGVSQPIGRETTMFMTEHVDLYK